MISGGMSRANEKVLACKLVRALQGVVAKTVKLQGKVIEYHSLPSNAGAQASDLMPVFSCWFVLFLLV